MPPVVLLIPKFLVFNQLGMDNSYSALIVPLLADAGGIFIMKQFFDPVPVSVTLPRGLADLVSGSLGAGTQYPLKLGAALPATIPVVIIFVIFQRFFVRDAGAGSDKG